MKRTLESLRITILFKGEVCVRHHVIFNRPSRVFQNLLPYAFLDFEELHIHSKAVFKGAKIPLETLS